MADFLRSGGMLTDPDPAISLSHQHVEGPHGAAPAGVDRGEVCRVAHNDHGPGHLDLAGERIGVPVRVGEDDLRAGAVLFEGGGRKEGQRRRALGW